jgi:hypothetical protein
MVPTMNIDLAIPDDELRRGLLTGIRMIPPPDMLDAETHANLGAQDNLLAIVVRFVCAAVGVAIPPEVEREHRCIAPGFWFASAVMGVTSAAGVVTVAACGRDGAPLHYRDGEGIDHRRQGVSAEAWAILALHEASHAAHHMGLGLGAAAVAVSGEWRGQDSEPEGHAEFVRGLHRRLTRGSLPAGCAPSRWPMGAPGMGTLVETFAAAVLPHAVGPAPAVRPCSEARWREAQGRSFAEDLRALAAEREAAAAWRAQGVGATP